MTMQALQAFARECVSALAEKGDGGDASIIRRRYGLDGLPEETLESLAKSKELDCTRESVRQRQNKALASLNARFGNTASNLVEQHVNEVWSQAVDGIFIAKASDLTTGRRSEADTRPALSGEYLLAWDVTAGKPRKTKDWLDCYAHQIGGAWFDRRMTSLAGDVTRIADAAGSIKQSLDKPVAIESLARQLDSEPSQLRALLVAAFPKERWDVHAGYIRRTGFTIRSRRAVQLHYLMIDVLARDIMDIRSLGRVYREHVVSDPCSDHDITIVIAENPQLFLQVGSGYWAPIGQTGAGFFTEPKRTASSILVDDAKQEDENTGGALGLVERIEKLLLDRGPQRLVDLYSPLEAQGVPRGSVVGIIGQNTRFIRILPGTYALDQQLQSVDLSRDAEALFNEKEVLVGYVRARFAGESFQRFPLWSWMFEYQLALWAERHKSSLLPELLAVAQPDNWPTSADEIARWTGLKLQHGNYRVGALPKLKPKKVSAREVLAALLLASKRGSSSVVTCSLIMKADGIDSSVGSALLMLLVANRAVSSGETWQSPHPVTDQATRWAERLGEELANTGELDWSSPAASAFLGAAGSSFPADGPWFRRSELETLLLLLAVKQQPADIPPAVAPPRPIASQDTLNRIAAETRPLPPPVAESIITNEELRVAAHSGDLESQYQLGIRTALGDGVRANPVMAIYWLRMAANSGHLPACDEMARLLEMQGRADHANDYRKKAAAIQAASAPAIAMES